MTTVIHHFPEDAVDGDVLVVESVDVKPDSVRIEYAIYYPPTEPVEARRNFRDAADALAEAVADHFRGGDPRLLPTYPPGSPVYLAMEAYIRARRVIGR